jgi:hypothetical protein
VFANEDRVWLATRNLPLRLPYRMLGPRFVGSFKVLKRVNEVCSQLQNEPLVPCVSPQAGGGWSAPGVCGTEGSSAPSGHREGPGVLRSVHPGFEASGEWPSITRGVGAVRSGGQVLGSGGGYVGPLEH